MPLQLPVIVNQEPLVVGTLKIKISLHRETIQAATKQGIDAEELSNLVAQKEMEVREYIGSFFEETE
jgi:hypothetical protein